ncbi:hypothetical protein [Pseudoduganella chitinolytica]|uniref:PH domain-containing protein n=1 Tax=Pseudoduganella chitinolytica TaxID=34070 RepID=A0ABY8B7M7_9BURK|nr:hypothetical protein [Pseudoduganella chitinolytica]WEF31895.1 hypothetical protein PX653_21040 [Pseudoduganella chitinolytica]
MAHYRPERTVSGPTYGNGFKAVATVLTIALAAYTVSVALRHPLPQFSFGVQALLAGAGAMLAVSLYWFLRATTTIDAEGIRQTGVIDRKVRWDEVRGAKMIGIPYLSWLFPPRMIVRTGTAFATFNGGTQDVLVEFARISLAFQMKK